MADTLSEFKNSRWSLWVWVIALVILLSASVISFYLRNFSDSLLLYLPTSIAIVLVHWLGLRVLPLTYINSYFTLWLWGAPGSFGYLLLLATREPVIIFTSWFLAHKTLQGSIGLSNTKSFVRFVLLGVVIPDLV